MLGLKLGIALLGILGASYLAGMLVKAASKIADDILRDMPVFYAGFLLLGAVLEFVFCVGPKLQLTFSKMALISIVLVILICVLSLLLCAFKQVRANWREEAVSLWGQGFKNWLLYMVLLICLCLPPFLYEMPTTDYNFTTFEKTVTVLQTDGLYQAKELTGQALAVPVAFMDRLPNLPAVYALICRSFLLVPGEIFSYLMPVLAVIMVLGGFAYLGSVFEKQFGISKQIFLLAAAMLILCGTSSYMNPAYVLERIPYEPEGIFALGLLPGFFAFLLSLGKGKLSKKTGIVVALLAFAMFAIDALLLKGIVTGVTVVFALGLIFGVLCLFIRE